MPGLRFGASPFGLPLPLTFRYRAGVTTYTSRCRFADGCVFGKQSPGPAFCRSHPYQREPHFFRSYVCFLPSSLTRGRSCALDCSSCLRVSVSGTVQLSLPLDSISRHLDYVRFASPALCSPSRLSSGTLLTAPSAPYRLDRIYRSSAGFHLMRPAFKTEPGIGF